MGFVTKMFLVLGAILLITTLIGCRIGYQGVRKTPFNVDWEYVHLEHVGVEIELPKEPDYTIFPSYIMSNYMPDGDPEVLIRLHLRYEGITPTGTSSLRLRIIRRQKDRFWDLIRDSGNEFIWSSTAWDVEKLFDTIQQKHVKVADVIGVGEPAIYRWDFMKCFEAPGGDVIIVSCIYAMNDPEDIESIKRMIDSVRPLR